MTVQLCRKFPGFKGWCVRLSFARKIIARFPRRRTVLCEPAQILKYNYRLTATRWPCYHPNHDAQSTRQMSSHDGCCQPGRRDRSQRWCQLASTANRYV